MPTKKCENCQTENHVRRLSCDKCGTAFKKKEKKVPKTSLDDISMGSWIEEKTKGLPKLELPEPLGNDMLDNNEIRNLISYEGLGFCVADYIQPNKIKDAHLKQLWIDCKNSMIEIKKYLY